MPTESPAIEPYRTLSLWARLAIALLCFERYCRAKALQHPSLTTFLDHMWELPCSGSFPDWSSRQNDLVHVGLGDPFPGEFIDSLQRAGIPEPEFRTLLESTVEIIYGSAFAASDDAGSLQYLDRVLRLTSSAGVKPPPAEPFSIFLFADRHGWGAVLSPEQRDQWRFQTDDNHGA